MNLTEFRKLIARGSLRLKRLYRRITDRGGQEMTSTTNVVGPGQAAKPLNLVESQSPPQPAQMNELEAYFYGNTGRLIHKWIHYFKVYDRHLSGFRGESITVVEFGVSQGGSLQMWKEYFGPRARIVGVDINPRCLALAEDQIEIVIGDQDDRDFLRSLRDKLGVVDIVIDDGGHRMSQQIGTFEELWPAVREGGVYLVEDTHTSYWRDWGGGYKRVDSFIEYAKALVDHIHAWHIGEGTVPNAYTRSLGGLHVYDSVVVFDKANVLAPTLMKTGTKSFGPRS